MSDLSLQIEQQIRPTERTADESGLQSAEFSRILLIKPSALGDVVHIIPLLVKLRARYPRARIDWLITPENAEVVRHHPALSNVVLFARRDFSKQPQWVRALLEFIDLLKQIRSAKFQILCHRYARTGALCLFLPDQRCACPHRIRSSNQVFTYNFYRA